MPYLLILAAFLIGSIPFGLLIGKACGVDVRNEGSRNIGATNVWRTCGPKAGVAAFLLDVLKGLGPTLAVRLLLPDTQHAWLDVLVGAAAVAGHTFSPWLGFKGGKGVATSLGVVFALQWIPAAVGWAMWFVAVGLTRYVSVGSLLGTLAAGITVSAIHAPAPHQIVVWLGVVLIWAKHRGNIVRLLRGEENRFNWRRRTAGEQSEHDA